MDGPPHDEYDGTSLGADAEAQRPRKPMYEDTHASCSVLLARIRNDDVLLQLDPHDQFRWLHRFYLVLDLIAEQHRVYKLYGGPHGFMISTGVAEADDKHAATLLRFALHLLQTVQTIRLPGQLPVDLVMVLASGEASSGLLGTTSLTYQIVSQSVAVARELMETQHSLPFVVTRGMMEELPPAVTAELVPVGTVPLRCCPGRSEAVWTLRKYAGTALRLRAGAAATAPADAGTPPPPAGPGAKSAGAPRQLPGLGPHAPAPAGLERSDAAAEAARIRSARARPAAEAASLLSVPSLEPRKPGLPLGGEGKRAHQAEAADGALHSSKQIRLKTAAWRLDRQQLAARSREQGMGSLPSNTTTSDSNWLSQCDLLLRFTCPKTEERFSWHISGAQGSGELACLLLSLAAAVLYCLAASWRAEAVPWGRVAQFQALPAVGSMLWLWRHDMYLRYREALWLAQRVVVLLATSLPGSSVFTSAPNASLFAFGLCNLCVEMCTRRLRLHLQLLSSLTTYMLALSVMSLHEDGTVGRSLIQPAYLSLHLAATCIVPMLMAAANDLAARRAFVSRLARLTPEAGPSPTNAFPPPRLDGLKAHAL